MSFKEAWKTVKISDIGRIVTGKTPKTSEASYYGGDIPFLTPSDDMSVKHISNTKRTLTDAGKQSVKNMCLPSGSVCVSCIGSDLGKVVITEHETVSNQQINSVIVDKLNFDIDFVYYAMLILGKKLNYLSKTSTAVPIVNKNAFSNYTISCPDLRTQVKISSVLSALDDKIENNNAINKNLDKQAQAIFTKHFIDIENTPDGWTEGSLTDIAEYLNGLAMQKFRPENEDDGLPVLKIKELRQGICDSESDRCSSEIKRAYIVHDGDVIFSWSGSLLVDFWCGGDCGLNQHLFKVTSEKYDKWFYYAWTNHHLQEFVKMAADRATTMGHIKRDALEKARVLIPNKEDYNHIGTLLQPLYDSIIANRIENRQLATLRDSLLPRLMSGEIDVSSIEV